MELNKEQEALLCTLLYSDIFNFPLSEEELWHELISDNKIDRNIFKKTAQSLSGLIRLKNGFYCIDGREKIIDKRKNSEQIAGKKLKIAMTIARYLAYIPTIYFIGITGKLSHNEAYVNDDIDMFFITKKNTMWTTRLLILAILEHLNIRRTRSDTKPKDKICPNLIIDETALAWPIEKHDLYTAHEITHVYPLLIRKNMYQKFLNSNKWIKRFYPNIPDRKLTKLNLDKPKQYYVLKILSFVLTLPLLEYIFDKCQRFYMLKNITNETIHPNFLAFHPHDYRREIMNKYMAKIRKYQGKYSQYRILTNI